MVLEATVSPSEDPLKVAAAIGNIAGMDAGAVSIGSRSARLVTTEMKAVEHVRDQLRDRRVRSAARRQLLVNSSGLSTSLMLNRQAAAAGVVAVCSAEGESPLGPVYLTLSSRRLSAAIDWLTPIQAKD
ncbi:MAG: hypothetical protein JRM73_01485 [Nitrososphaerota archaeon]|nr:hypothetical protein [Nitrososphaerota archaeon]